MTPLAYVLIVVIPLTAFVTVALALLPGRPRAGRAMDSGQISARIEVLDEELRAEPADDRQVRQLRRERRRLHDELLRRGLGR